MSTHSLHPYKQMVWCPTPGLPSFIETMNSQLQVIYLLAIGPPDLRRHSTIRHYLPLLGCLRLAQRRAIGSPQLVACLNYLLCSKLHELCAGRWG